MATLCWEDVQVGQELPDVARDVNATLIAGGAIWATHDFMPVHHDPKFAQEKGAPDIFMNILTDNGLVAAYVGNWAGPDAELKKLTSSLQVPNFPGDRMTMMGRVVKKYKDGAQHLIDVSVVGENNLGPHVAGTATLALPTRG